MTLGVERIPAVTNMTKKVTPIAIHA